MKKKQILSSLMLLLILGTNIADMPAAAAASTLTKTDTRTFKITTPMTYKAGEWIPIAGSGYEAAYGADIDYATDGFEGKLKATEIMISPNNNYINWTGGGTAVRTAYDYSAYLEGSPTFNATKAISVVDAETGQAKIYNIAKSGVPNSIGTTVEKQTKIVVGDKYHYDKNANFYWGIMGYLATVDYQNRPWNLPLSDMSFGSYYQPMGSTTGLTAAEKLIWTLDYGKDVWGDATAINADTFAKELGSKAAQLLTYDPTHKQGGKTGDGWWFLSMVNPDGTGGNLNKYRKGINLTYYRNITKTKYEQKYSGTVPLPSHESNDWTVTVKYSGTVTDKNANDFTMDSVTVSPASAFVFNGGPTAKTISVTFKVSNETYPVVSGSQSPWITIKNGGVLLWSGTVSIPRNGSTTKTVSVSPSLLKGANTISVEVNGNRNITEFIPDGAPYNNNIMTAVVTGNIYESDLVLSNVSFSPLDIPILDEDTQITQDIKLSFTLTHYRNANASIASLTPNVVVKNGTTVVYDKPISIAPGSTINTAIDIPITLFEGPNSLTVEVNENRAIQEYMASVANPYLNNKAGKTLQATQYQSNLVLESISVLPGSVVLYDGNTSVTEPVTIDYTVQHNESISGVLTPMAVDVVFKNGSTILGHDSIMITPGGKVSAKASFNAILVSGMNDISVEINPGKVYFEYQKGVSNPYLDNKKSSTIDTQVYQTNLFIESVTVTPSPVILDRGTTSKVQSSNISFVLKHERLPIGDNTQLSPKVVIRNGGVIIWQGDVPIIPGGTTERSILVSTQYNQGNNLVEVEVNGDKALYESKTGVVNPYADNEKTANVLGIIPTTCVLPNPAKIRTLNTWSENWTIYDQKGNVGVKDGNNYCDITSYTETVTKKDYIEEYTIENVYFRSKWSKDLKFDDYPSDGLGWMRVELGQAPKIKAGYGFEIKVVTLYETNRNVIPAFAAYYGDYYIGGKYGSGFCDYTVRTPNITPMDSPNTIYINLDNGSGTEVCYILDNTSASGTWYQSRKVFELPLKDTLGIKDERKIYTSTDGKTGVYGVTISTPRPDVSNQFKGYEAEAPAIMTNKSYLHDVSNFTIEVLSQDDIKSHIIQ